ncbi:hypothetical protein BGZ73_009088 [Actinomortierella ambigua]|nr:hypothetical protein BGZ73_009088 [Actinomortierella ambigua]
MASAKPTLPDLRALHYMERYHVSRGNTDAFYNVIVGPRIRARNATAKHLHPSTDNHLDWVKFLASPLTWLIQEHSTLSAVVRDHLSNEPWFVRLPSVDLAKVVRVTTIQNAKDIGSVMQDENNLPFDLADWSVPLWRLIVVRVESDGSFYLLYNFHHAIGDGRSAMALTEQLYERVNIAVREADKNADLPLVVAAPQDKAMLPALEQRADCNPRFKTLMKTVIPHLLLPKVAKKALETKYWAGEIDARPEHENVTELEVFQLTQAETTSVAQTAKKHQNTVQSMLFAAAVFALQSCFIYPLQIAGDTVDPVQRFATPVAMRDLLGDKRKIGRAEQGAYTCEQIYDIEIRPNSSYWKIAADYRQSIVKGTQTPEGVQHMLEHGGMLKYVPNHPGGWEEFFREQFHDERHGRRASLMISNLGRAWEMRQPPLQDSQEDQLDAYVIEDAIFSQSSETIGMGFVYSVATANGILTATNTWQKSGLHGRERGEWFTRETKRILLQACQPNLSDLTFQEAFDASEPRP